MNHNEDLFKTMLDLFANPAFRAGFTEFTKKAHIEGLEVAKKFWDRSDYGTLFPFSGDMIERLIEWHKALGFVSMAEHNKILEENTILKAENRLLREMMQDFQVNLINDGGKQVQQVFQDLIDKQAKMSTEVSNNFFEALRQFKPNR